MFINPSPPLPFPNSCTTVLSRQRDQGLLKMFGQVHPNTASLPGLRPPSPSNFPNSAGGAGNLLSAHWHPLMNRLLAHFQDDGSTPSQSGRRQLSKGGTLRPTFAAGKGDLHPALGYKRQLFKGRLAIRLMPSHSWGGGEQLVSPASAGFKTGPLFTKYCLPPHQKTPIIPAADYSGFRNINLGRRNENTSHPAAFKIKVNLPPPTPQTFYFGKGGSPPLC